MCIGPIVLHRSWRHWNLSLVGIVTRLQTGRSGIRTPAGARDFSYSNRPDLLWGPSSLLLDGCRGSFPGVKRLGRDVDHSLHLAPRLNMSEAILLLIMRAFVSRTGTILYIFCCIVNACKVTGLTKIYGWKCGWILCSAAEHHHTVSDNFKVSRGWNFYLKHFGGNSWTNHEPR